MRPITDQPVMESKTRWLWSELIAKLDHFRSNYLLSRFEAIYFPYILYKYIISILFHKIVDLSELSFRSKLWLPIPSSNSWPILCSACLGSVRLAESASLSLGARLGARLSAVPVTHGLLLVSVHSDESVVVCLRLSWCCSEHDFVVSSLDIFGSLDVVVVAIAVDVDVDVVVVVVVVAVVVVVLSQLLGSFLAAIFASLIDTSWDLFVVHLRCWCLLLVW